MPRRAIPLKINASSAAPGSTVSARAGPARNSSYDLGFVGSALDHPPDQVTRLSQGFYGPSQGLARQARYARIIRPRTGPAWISTLSAAPGSTVLNWPAPLGAQVTISGSSALPRTGPPDQVTRLSQGFYGPSQGLARQARYARIIRPRTGPAWISTLSAAPGSTVLNWPAPLGAQVTISGSSALPRTGPPDQVTRLSQGFYGPAPGVGPPGTLRQVHRPAPGRPGRCLTPLGFIGPTSGVGPLLAIYPGSRANQRPGPRDDQDTGAPAQSGPPGYPLPLRSTRF